MRQLTMQCYPLINKRTNHTCSMPGKILALEWHTIRFP